MCTIPPGLLSGSLMIIPCILWMYVQLLISSYLSLSYFYTCVHLYIYGSFYMLVAVVSLLPITLFNFLVRESPLFTEALPWVEALPTLLSNSHFHLPTILVLFISLGFSAISCLGLLFPISPQKKNYTL